MKAWTKLHTFRLESQFSTWLHRVAANVALSDRRIRMRRVEKEQPLDATYADQALAVGATNVGQVMDLEAAIAKLPERARTVLVLHDVEGYRHRDIAEVTGMAVGSSKAQLHRARKLLQESLAR